MPARAYTEAIVVTAASPRVVSHTVISRPPALVHEAGGFALGCVASATAVDVLASASAQKRPRREGGMAKRTAIAAVLVFACFAAGAQAQDYPSRPITLLVPYAAGGGNDVMARIVAEKMSRSLGQQIVIENKGGAGGSI